MKNNKHIPINHYKVKSLSNSLQPNSVYYVLEQIDGEVKTYITDLNGFPIPLIDETTQGVLTVAGTGVTGSQLHPRVDIETFVSSQLGNQVYLSSVDDKLQVNPITSPDSSIEITSASTELQIQLSSVITSIINSALQPGDNISELVNDTGYVTLLDLSTVAETGDYNDLINKPSTFPPSAHTHPISDIINLQTELDDRVQYTRISVSNKTGSTINKGSVVYINGAQGNKPTIDLSLADINDITSKAIGITYEIINNNSTGYVYTNGLIDGLNTSTFPEGAALFISDTVPGGLTLIPPTSPSQVIFVGTCIYQHNNQGRILIDIQTSFRLDKLKDVDILSATTNQYLYKNSDGFWKAKTIPVEDVTNAESILNKGIANGYAALDAGGKIPASQLPNSVMELQGEWNASTNTPTLIDGVGNPGDIWKVTTAGTQNLGSGNITFGLNDFAIYGSNGVWFKSDNTDAVNSVFGRVGTIVAQNGDYTAFQITNVPSGNISSITVQAALNELDSEKAIDANVIHTTGNESWTGIKSSVNTGLTQINGIDLTNNGTNGLIGVLKITNNNIGIGVLTNNIAGGSGHTINNSSSGQGLTVNNTGTSNGIQITNSNIGDGINITNSVAGNAITFFNQSTGYGLQAFNSSTGRGIFAINSSTGQGGYYRNSANGTSLFSQNESTGNGIVSNGTIASTGFIFVGRNNGVDTFTVDKFGNVTSNSFIKSGATTSNILLAGGSDIPQSTFELSANKQNSLNVDGTGVKFPTVDAVNNEFDIVQSTGLLWGGQLSINADPTKFDIAAGEGYIVDSTDFSNITRTKITWSASTGNAVTDLLTQPVTFILIDTDGSIYQQVTFPTPEEKRNKIFIGRLNHSNLTTITFVDTFPNVLQSPISQYFDLVDAIGSFSYKGNIISANGANLSIDKSIGNSFFASLNYVPNNQSINNIEHPGITLVTFRHQNRNSTDGSNITVIDPTNYDFGGVTTPVPNPIATATAMRVYLFPSNTIRIQRGQATYVNLAAAIAGYKNEVFIENPTNIGFAIWIATIIVQKNCTSLLDGNTSKIIIEPKFGGSTGAAGIGTSTLQTAYNNSTIPQIVTSTALGALSIRRGSVSNNDNIIVGQNGGGVNTFEVKGNGNTVINTQSSAGSGYALDVKGNSGGTFFVQSHFGTSDGMMSIGANNLGQFIINGGRNINGNFSTTSGSRISSINGRIGFETIGGAIAGTPFLPIERMVINEVGSVIINNNILSDTGHKLQVTGDARLTGDITSNSFIKSGGLSTQFLKADGSVDSTIYAIDANVVHKTGDESISGNKVFNDLLGVGVLSPIGKLQVRTGTNENYGIFSNSGRVLHTTFNDANTNIVGVTHSALDYRFLVNGLQKVRFESDGRVLINTSTNNGVDALQVNGSVSSSSFIKSGAASTNILLAGGGDIAQSTFIGGSGTTNYIPKWTGATTVGNSSIYDDGTNVGIRTNTPSYALDINTDSSSGFRVASPTSDTYIVPDFYGTGVSSILTGAGSKHLAFGISSSEKMRITNNGNVLIKTPTDNGVDALQVNGSGYFSSVGNNNVRLCSSDPYISWNNSAGTIRKAYIQHSSSVLTISNDESGGIVLGNNTTIIGNANITSLAGTGTRTVVADASGNLSAPVSDISLKENIQPLHYGLNEIMKMNPVSYNFKDKEKYGEGLYLGNIAQDMEKVIPEAVFTDDNTGKMGIEYSHMHAVYIKAIQEQQSIIEKLLLRIEKLETK